MRLEQHEEGTAVLGPCGVCVCVFMCLNVYSEVTQSGHTSAALLSLRANGNVTHLRKSAYVVSGTSESPALALAVSVA